MTIFLHLQKIGDNDGDCNGDGDCNVDNDGNVDVPEHFFKTIVFMQNNQSWVITFCII